MSNTPIVTPGRPYSARVEYFACREYAEAMLARGHSVRSAYEHMKEQGRVTCSYSAFCDYVRGGGKRLHSRRGKKLKPANVTLAKSAGPIIVGSSREPFPDPRTMNIDDCI